MFDYFRQAKADEVAALQKAAANGTLPEPLPERRPSFSGALRAGANACGLSVIAEYKIASPSQGDIALEVTPGAAAAAYASAGASAMSVLTEESKFKGSLSFIHDAWAGGAGCNGLPLLRKDFIFEPLQVLATAATPASAVLLIVKLTPSATLLRELRQTAESFGLECVVEILDEKDLAIARQSGATIIQANARDFSDLSVDLNRSLALARRHAGEADELWIAASGFSRAEELRPAAEAGFTAILAGTALMRGGNPAESLARLTAGLTEGK